MLRTSLTAQVGEQSCTTQLFSVWRDVTKQYGTDRYGNQILPTQMTEKVPVDDYVRDQTGVDCQPFRFLLTKGEQTLTLESHNADLELSRIRLVRADSVPDYAKYRSALGEREAGKDKIVIQGENYSVKSDSSIRAASARNPSLDPYDYRYLLMCELDGDSCGEAGQKVEYAFVVETAGLYRLTFHYRQGEVEDIPVYRNIRVDGRSLFRELNSVAFPYTGRDYGNLTVTAEGEPISIACGDLSGGRDPYPAFGDGRHTLTGGGSRTQRREGGAFRRGSGGKKAGGHKGGFQAHLGCGELSAGSAGAAGEL